MARHPGSSTWRTLALGLGVTAVCASATAAATEKPRIAVVVGAGAGWDGRRVDQVRAELGHTYQLLEDPELREALESATRAASPEAQLRTQLDEARQFLRRFDMASVGKVMEKARGTAGQLEPSAPGRGLALELALREAEIALIANDLPAQERAMAVALSIDPALKLDPAEYPPTFTKLLKVALERRAKASRATLRVVTKPAGARVFISNELRGTTPASLAELPAGPTLIWLVQEGQLPRAVRVNVGVEPEVVASLNPVPARGRIEPLVEALRRSQGPERGALAQALAGALGVEGVALVEAVGAPPSMHMLRPSADTALGVGTAPSAQQGHNPLSGVRWPAWTAAGLSAALAIGGVAFGIAASQDAAAASSATFASDGVVLSGRAHQKAQLANGLYVAAGGVAALGVVLVFAF